MTPSRHRLRANCPAQLHAHTVEEFIVSAQHSIHCNHCHSSHVAGAAHATTGRSRFLPRLRHCAPERLCHLGSLHQCALYGRIAIAATISGITLSFTRSLHAHLERIHLHASTDGCLSTAETRLREDDSSWIATQSGTRSTRTHTRVDNTAYCHTVRSVMLACAHSSDRVSVRVRSSSGLQNNYCNSFVDFAVDFSPSGTITC
jgi:hypothetical protein